MSAHAIDAATSTAPSPPPWLARTDIRRLFVSMTAVFGVAGLTQVIASSASWQARAIEAAACLTSVLLTLSLIRVRQERMPTLAIGAALIAASALLIVAFTATGEALAVFATGLPFAFAIAWYRPRWLSACGLVLAIWAAVASVGISTGGGYPVTAGFAMSAMAGAVCVGFVGATVGWQLQLRMDRYHADQRALALTRERLRFATDLHDIQGHTLLAIKLKAELARRILGRDPARAEAELVEIEALAGEADRRTRELAHGYRTLNLATELANAERLLTAAGMAVTVERAGVPATGWDDLLAAVVREATTNVLRHSEATSVRIVLSETALSLENDGAVSASHGQEHTGSGLESLGRRFADRGGSCTWQQHDGRFTIAGRIG